MFRVGDDWNVELEHLPIFGVAEIILLWYLLSSQR